jgi:hypothetical protein
MPRTRQSTNGVAESSRLDSSRDLADRLFRAAAECVRQRERYARLVATGIGDAEQEEALEVLCLCDKTLRETAKAYEQGATRTSTESRTTHWWRKANTLWHATREYERRYQNCEKTFKRLEARTREKLGELAMEYDLEASSLLALRQALNDYRKVCPEADMEARPQSIVA